VGDTIECRDNAGLFGELQAAITANQTAIAALVGLESTTVYSTGSYSNPAWLTSLAGSKIAGNIGGTAASLTAPIAESQVTNLVSDLAARAPLASPAFTGTPTAPTAALAVSTTQIATTQFVHSYVASLGYITGNQTIALSGDVSGSGATAITAT